MKDCNICKFLLKLSHIFSATSSFIQTKKCLQSSGFSIMTKFCSKNNPLFHFNHYVPGDFFLPGSGGNKSFDFMCLQAAKISLLEFNSAKFGL